MEGPAVVAPMGRLGGFSSLGSSSAASPSSSGRSSSSSPSPMCRCCGQSLLCSRIPLASGRRRGVSPKVCSSSGDPKQQQNFRRESCRRLTTGIVSCEYGKAHEALQGAQDLVGGRRWGGGDGAQLRREVVGGGGGFREGREQDVGGDGAFSYRDGKGGGAVAMSSIAVDGDSAWHRRPSSPLQAVRNNGEKEGFHSGGFGHQSSDSWPMQNPAAAATVAGAGAGGGGVGQGQGSMAASRTNENNHKNNIASIRNGIWDMGEGAGASGGNWQADGRREANNTASFPSSSGQQLQQRQTRSAASSSVPASELTKIEELRFSGDMQEGDSGPQVLNLQRALFWLGHLRGLSLTGYFGPETTRALREFHYSHGMPNTGVWGFASQQVLWRHFHPEVSPRLQSVMGGPERSQSKERKFPDRGLRNNLVKDLSGRARDTGLRASRALQKWQCNKRAELLAAVSALPLPGGTSVEPGQLGILFLSTLIVSSIAMLVIHVWPRRVQGQPVKRRVMSWRNGGRADVGLRRQYPRTAMNAPSSSSSSSKTREGERTFLRNSSQNSVRQMSPTSRSSKSSDGNLVDRLVLFEGDVVRGEQEQQQEQHPDHLKMLQRPRMKLGGQINGSDPEDDSSPLSTSGQKYAASWGQQEAQKRNSTPGYDEFHEFQKPEMDPPRNHHYLSPKRSSSGKLSRPIMNEQQQKQRQGAGGDGSAKAGPASSPSGWAAWFSYFFPVFSAAKERLPSTRGMALGRPRKGNSRRVVVGGGGAAKSSRKTKAPEKGFSTDSGMSLNSSKNERGLASSTQEAQKWQEQNELDLKSQVEDLHRTVQSVEQTRVAAVRALAEEKMHNLELEVKIRRQKEAASALEEELRVMKDSHEALLETLKKKYSSSAAARAAAALLYQNWDPSDSSSARV